ncbi:hypothetical protein [Clostridium botulinum]|nr:hypothetical protein [Clostridium botulinum]MCD3241443.1 hypothetical protein [Clostridium botulinum D/C]MCD3307161.1 hypothetical protein [Clostridium botulinum D/C]MCD3337510.1 hypothetical protein [Clostridium botulinum D/C]MCD3343373.1 hypothetical protein [Clostridium botulinum D/C]
MTYLFFVLLIIQQPNISDTPYKYYFTEFKIAEDKQTINFPSGNATNIEIYALGW